MEQKEKLWTARIDEWKRSGLSQRQYCEENHLALATFWWWRKRLKAQERASTSGFIEIPRSRSLVTENPSMSALQIVIGGYTVAITGTVDRGQLGAVLDVLEQR